MLYCSEPVTRVRCGISRHDMVVVAYQNYDMSQIHLWGREERPVWC